MAEPTTRNTVFKTRPCLSARRATVLSLAGVLAVFFLANHRLVLGTATGKWDADSQFCPWQTLVADHARTGRLLLWNPWTNGGSPDFADPQFGAMSPINVIYGFITGGSEAAFRGLWLLLWLVGGLGMMVLAFHLGAPAWGAFIVAIAFHFSGFLTGHAEHTAYVHAFAALPWIVWRFDCALIHRRPGPAVQAGAIWGLSALAGYPGLVISNAGLVILWTLGRVGFNRSDRSAAAGTGRKHWSTAVGFLGLWLIVGAIVMSPTYVGFLVEMRGFTDRSGPLPRETAVASNALHPAAIASFASPYLPMLAWFNRPHLWPYNDVSSISVYCGGAVFWMAVVALVMRPTGWRWWLAAMGVLGLGLALGQTLPLRGWLYDLLPPTRFFRHPSIFRTYPIFVVLVLAAHASADFSNMLKRARPKPSRSPISPSEKRPDPDPAPSHRAAWTTVAASGWTASVLALATFAAVMASVKLRGPDVSMAWSHLLLSWSGVMVAAASARFAKYRKHLPMLMVIIAVGDALFSAHLSRHTIWTDDPNVLNSWTQLNRHHVGNLTVPGSRVIHIGPGITNKNLLLKVPVLQGYSPTSNRFHEQGLSSRPFIATATGPKAFWFAPDTATAMTHLSDATATAFWARAEQLTRPPLVVHPRTAMVQPVAAGEPGPFDNEDRARIQAAPAAHRIDVTITEYEPTRLVFSAHIPESGYLLITDRWARGWRATVNDRPTPVLGGNFIFRAIAVGVGSHTVVMTYHPFGYPTLLATSWILLALIVCATFDRWVVGKKFVRQSAA